MKRIITAFAIVAALSIIGGAAAAVPQGPTTGPNDQGRRLAGPFCVGLSTGIVRAVPAAKPCKKGELRRFGFAVPHPETVAGPAGPAGPQGPQGPAGQNGKDGKDAVAFVKVTQLPGNCVLFTGSDGSTGKICGAQGPKGDKGDRGDDGHDGGCKKDDYDGHGGKS